MKKHKIVTGCSAKTAAIILTAAMTFQNASPAFAATSVNHLKQLAAEAEEDMNHSHTSGENDNQLLPPPRKF